MNIMNDWTWIDFILHSSLILIFLIATFILTPINIYEYLKVGLKQGFSKKVDEFIFGNTSVLLKIMLSCILILMGIHVFFIDGILFKYLSKAHLFLK